MDQSPASRNTSCLITIKNCLFTLLYFCLAYSVLIAFLIPLIIIFLYRSIISVIFKLFYRSRFKLMEPLNSTLAPDIYGSVHTMYCSLFIDGPVNISFLRERVHQKLTETNNGSLPYGMMLSKVVKKFGFFCWELSEFDITHHIRYFPGLANDRVYSEEEFFKAVGAIADKTWEGDKPRWEFLIVAKIRMKNKIVSVVHLRVHHCLSDGISLFQLVGNVLADEPPQLFINPMEPPPHLPYYVKIFIYLQVFFLGPCLVLGSTFHRERHSIYEGPLRGKFFGRTESILIKKLKEIRAIYGCSTTTILHFALTGAIQELAKRKGILLLGKVVGCTTAVFLPYPDIYPQNRIAGYLQNFPVGELTWQRRLWKIHNLCNNYNTPTTQFILESCRLTNYIVGMLPARLIEFLVVIPQITYCVSNVPTFKGTLEFNGSPCILLTAVPPLLNGMKFAAASLSYKDSFVYGVECEKSEIITNYEDFQDFVNEFQNQIYMLFNSETNDK